jgi:hypothetical protein
VPDVAYNGAILHGVLTYLNIPGITPGFYRFGDSLRTLFHALRNPLGVLPHESSIQVP